MKNEDLGTAALVVVAGVILIPVLVNGSIAIVDAAFSFADYLGQRHVYNKKIKKGLKDGSVIIIDGKFYEVEDIVEEN